MDHININKRKIRNETYWLTDDINIIMEITTASQEIHLDKIRDHIERLEKQLEINKPIELPEELLSQLNQAMTASLNDGGQTFQKISDLVYAQNGHGDEHIQYELDRLNVLLAKVT